MLRVRCCVRCGVHSGLSSYQSNYASCNAQMNTNDCDDADSDKYDDDDDKRPTYCPERHSYRQRRSHIGGNSSRGRHTLKEILFIFFFLIIIIANISDYFLNHPFKKVCQTFHNCLIIMAIISYYISWIYFDMISGIPFYPQGPSTNRFPVEVEGGGLEY